MTTVGEADLRSRLYEAYASQHAGSGGDEAAALVCRRGSRTLLLPPPAVGSDSVLVRSAPPVAHGLANAARTMDWEVVIKLLPDRSRRRDKHAARPHRHPERDIRDRKGAVTVKPAKS